MYIGTKRNPEKVISLWIMTFGLYGIYWLAQTFNDLQKNRKKGMTGNSFAVLAVLFPPLALSACWILPEYVGKLYEENGKLEYINSGWGIVLFLPTLALWAIVGMAYFIISTGFSTNEYGMYIMSFIVMTAIGINVFILYNWLKKIQIQINEFWDEAA